MDSYGYWSLVKWRLTFSKFNVPLFFQNHFSNCQQGIWKKTSAHTQIHIQMLKCWFTRHTSESIEHVHVSFSNANLQKTLKNTRQSCTQFCSNSNSIIWAWFSWLKSQSKSIIQYKTLFQSIQRKWIKKKPHIAKFMRKTNQFPNEWEIKYRKNCDVEIVSFFLLSLFCSFYLPLVYTRFYFLCSLVCTSIKLLDVYSWSAAYSYIFLYRIHIHHSI